MGIRAVSHERVGGLDHRRREVGVRVDRADDRDGAHTLANEREPVTVDVAHRVAHRGPVRRDEQAVERAGSIERRR